MSDSTYFKNLYNMNFNEVNQNFLYIGEGISRVVFAINDFAVVKFSKNLDGFDQCHMENKIYTTEKKDIKNILCPILYYKNGMIIMKRAIPLNQFTENKYINTNSYEFKTYFNKKIKKLSQKYNLLYEDLISTTSWGILDGKMLLIDYGCIN